MQFPGSCPVPADTFGLPSHKLVDTVGRPLCRVTREGGASCGRPFRVREPEGSAGGGARRGGAAERREGQAPAAATAAAAARAGRATPRVPTARGPCSPAQPCECPRRFPRPWRGEGAGGGSRASCTRAAHRLPDLQPGPASPGSRDPDRAVSFLPTPTPTPGAENAASPHKSRRLRLCRARRRLLPFRAQAAAAVPRGSTVGRPEGEPETPIWAWD